jgi:hypothetical protein
MKEHEGAYAATEASNNGAVKARSKSCGITLRNPTAHAHISGAAEKANGTILELARMRGGSKKKITGHSLGVNR